jgi:hypothetical protein
MPDRKSDNDALPDDQPANDANPRNINAPDLGGSLEENGQVRRHDGIGAAPGMQPVIPLTSQKAAKKTEDNSSAGS